jgi:hypothetical protein
MNMKLQIIQDSAGKEAGVFIPMDDWNRIKYTYPDIDTISDELPQWHKEALDKELLSIENGTAGLKEWGEAKKQFRV